MLELKENVLDTDTYLYLRKKVGWIKLTDKQAEQAVNNSLLCVHTLTVNLWEWAG